MTISAAPVDLESYRYNAKKLSGPTHLELLRVFEKIQKALDLGNYDNSEHMSEYFDVGHYTDIRIGCREKPFQLTK